MSVDIIERILNKEGLHARIQKKVPSLSENNISARFAWGKAHEDWKFEDFRRIVYSDECRVVAKHNNVHFVRKYCTKDDYRYYQQDGATCHTSKKSMEYFNKKGIRIFEHPAKSPDLSPIEHIWPHLKEGIWK